MQKLLSISKIRSLRRGEYLVEEGMVCNIVALVIKGTLRSFIRTDQEEFNNDFYFNGDFGIALTSYLTGRPTNCNIQALEFVDLLVISKQDMLNLENDDPDFLRLSKYIAENYFIRKCKRESSFLKFNASDRLSVALELYPGIQQKVSQFHIASYLGIKPETLSRVKLASLKRIT
ncbi:hypothetical protein AB669_04055 [Pedobacter sp. BMA]|nr:hypothetical protein AB669_04055 [Pedobacter sp. BMA]